ncbi:MAG: DNA primase [Beijerinckiaceae bacterium]
MRFPPSILDEIRARLPVSAVVGRRVKLVKSGREWKGLSPFQSEKTPSFYVNDQKGFYHDFSSGKHGDIFRFVMETEGLAFPEVVERLAQEVGIQLPKMQPESVEQEKKRNDLYDVVELAAKFFEAELRRPGGAAARAYIEKRRIEPRTQAEFRFGFAPEGRDNLVRHLRALGITDRQLIDAGLAIEPEDDRAIYDRFRNRVIFPIQDGKGRVVAFGGRVLDPEGKPKYLNSPETELFRKGHLVFNGHRAREAAFKAGTVIATEGYLDAIAVWQAGLRHVVATLGTAFTEEQIATLWRFAPEPIICFDGDKAGVAAANRAIDRIVPALKTGFSFRFAFLPGGQDPDDLIQAKGVEAFAAVTDQAVGLFEALWARETSTADVSSPDRQAMLEKAFRDLTDQIADPLVKRRYEISARTKLNQFFWEKGAGARRPGRGSPREALKLSIAEQAAMAANAPRLIVLERLLLGLCVQFPELAGARAERLATLQFRGAHKAEHFGSVAFERLLSDLLAAIDVGEISGVADLYEALDPFLGDSLDALHGRVDGQRELEFGHRLFEKLPALRNDFDLRIAGAYMDHFMRQLEFREAEDELQLLSTLPADKMTDSAAERLFELKRDIESDRAALALAEHALAEAASGERKSAFGHAPPSAGIAARSTHRPADSPEF